MVVESRAPLLPLLFYYYHHGGCFINGIIIILLLDDDEHEVKRNFFKKKKGHHEDARSLGGVRVHVVVHVELIDHLFQRVNIEQRDRFDCFRLPD